MIAKVAALDLEDENKDKKKVKRGSI